MTVLRNIGNIEIDESDLPRETFARSQYEEARLLAVAQHLLKILIKVTEPYRQMVHQNLINTMVHLMFLVNRGKNLFLGFGLWLMATKLSGLKEILQEIETGLWWN